MSGLDDYWEEARKTPTLPVNEYPATFGCLSGETIHPWSARLGAITKLQRIIDWNVTAKSIVLALKLCPVCKAFLQYNVCLRGCKERDEAKK